MTDLDKAIAAGRAEWLRMNSNLTSAITAALRSLAEPSEEAVEAMARALAKQAHQHVLGAARWQKFVPDARASHAAYIKHLLGEL